MNPEQVRQSAMSRFGEDGLFCAESVLSAVAEAAGLESSLIPRVATGFCGGVSRTCGMCGAVAGGVMALGLVFGRDYPEEPKDECYDRVQRFLAAFAGTCGSTNCRELTGCDLGTEAGRAAFEERGLVEDCRRYTGLAAGLVAEIIGNDG